MLYQDEWLESMHDPVVAEQFCADAIFREIYRRLAHVGDGGSHHAQVEKHALKVYKEIMMKKPKPKPEPKPIEIVEFLKRIEHRLGDIEAVLTIIQQELAWASI